MSERGPRANRTSLFERASAALGFVFLACVAGALGLISRRTPAPRQTPLDLVGPSWRRVATRTFSEFNNDQIPQVAGGVAFFALLSLFPALAAFVSLYGLFADVNQVPQHLATLAGVLPHEALSFVSDEMTRLAGGKHPALGLAFAISLVASLWSANGAVKALFAGLNTAYEAKEHRGLIELNLISLAFTVAGLAFVLTAFGLVVAAPPVLLALGWKGSLEPWVIDLLRWSTLFIGSVFSLAILYRFGPCRTEGHWRWATPGSAFATVAWLLMSMGFSWYVSNVGHYERTYGSLGAVVGFMTWLWLSTIVILAGAELNSEIEAEAAILAERRPPPIA